MKKVLFLSILALFVCANYAFSTSEATSDIQFKGDIITLKDGCLPATLYWEPVVGNDDKGFFSGKLTVKADKDGKTVYNSTFECTGWDDGTFFTITTKGTAILWYSVNTASIILQIPGDGITGKFPVNPSQP